MQHPVMTVSGATLCNSLQPCHDAWRLQKAPDITREALEESNPLSEEAVDLFLAIIGAEAGYMGVRALASGGIYICGGITPRVRILLGSVLAG